MKDKWIPKEGFNPDVPNDLYHLDRTHVSSSSLKLLLEDPRAFVRRYVNNEPDSGKSSASMDFGSYVHCAILEPHLLEQDFAIYEGARRAGKAWEEFKEANSDKIIIMQSQKIEADKAVNIFNDAEVYTKDSKGNDKLAKISSFFKKGKAEECLCGELDGVKVKVKFDYRREFETFGSINDIKTTSFPINNKKEIESVSARWGYEVSAALYVDLVTKYTQKPHDFYFCYINTKDSVVKLVKASKQMLEAGRKKYKEALRLLKKGRETGDYFEKGILEIDYVEK
jgi:hypothetical protein